MSIRTFLRSFAGGEITPELFGRLDLTKNQTGLQAARNFVIKPHGPAENRAGFGYVIETKDSSKHSVLIPFIFNTSQTYVLEFGNLYMRIHTAGGTVLEAAQAITSATNANPGVFTKVGHGYSTGDWLFWSGVTGMAQLGGRFMKVVKLNNDTFSLTDLAGGAFNTAALGTFTAGSAARVYEIATPFAEADLFDLHYTQSDDVLTITHDAYAPQEGKRLGAVSWTMTAPSFAPTMTTPSAPTATAGGAGGGTPITQDYVTTALAADGLEESLPSANATASVDLTVAGNHVDVAVDNTVGATRINIYKLSNGLYGYIGQTAPGGTLRDSNIVPDISKTPPINDTPFSGAGNYPNAVGYFQGRRWFGGTDNRRQNVWATRSGTESNMSYSIPTRDDDSIRVRLTARQANRIQHIVPLADLLVLTSGSEVAIQTANSDVITPTSIDPKPQDFVGASSVQPVVTARAVLYAQARGGHVREIKFAWQSQGYQTRDISILAPHLFDDYTLTSATFTQARVPVSWWTRSDGMLLGLTYVPDQQIEAWHRHDTAGSFESVCAVPEGNEDALYAIVQRTVNGRTVRYVERQHTRRFDTLADCFFVDAGVTYDGAATTTISGLWHLIGARVSVLGDGAVFPPATVGADGTITLDHAVSKAQVGLAYTCDLETVPLTVEGAPGAGQGNLKNINRASLRLYRSSGVFVGPSFDKLTELKQRTTEPYGAPPSLISGVFPLSLSPSWQQDGSVCVRQSDPLPVTVTALGLEVALGG